MAQIHGPIFCPRIRIVSAVLFNSGALRGFQRAYMQFSIGHASRTGVHSMIQVNRVMALEHLQANAP